MIQAVIAGPSAYWYLTRGTGTVALILLTLSVVLGVANSRRLRTERVPRFVVDAVHRNVSLLAVAFTAVHVITSLLDGFAPIAVVDVFIPFVSAYRPIWLGFGAVAFDLLLALVITSMLRRRFGYRLWRLTHWTAYGCWPVALLHTFGTGSDVKFGWLLAISAICAALVIAAVLMRTAAGWPSRPGIRLTAILACAAVPLGLIVWLPSGPLAKDWAKRAGTPSYLLASSTRATSAASAANAGGPPSFTAQVTGTVRQGESTDGLQVVDLSMTANGQRLNALDIRIIGQALESGGVQLTRSRVTLGSSADPAQYSGRVTSLRGTDIAARLRNSSGSVVLLAARLQLDPSGGSIGGTVRVSPASG
jgi:hypothetical protein